MHTDAEGRRMCYMVFPIKGGGPFLTFRAFLAVLKGYMYYSMHRGWNYFSLLGYRVQSMCWSNFFTIQFIKTLNLTRGSAPEFLGRRVATGSFLYV